MWYFGSVTGSSKVAVFLLIFFGVYNAEPCDYHYNLYYTLFLSERERVAAAGQFSSKTIQSCVSVGSLLLIGLDVDVSTFLQSQHHQQNRSMNS